MMNGFYTYSPIFSPLKIIIIRQFCILKAVPGKYLTPRIILLYQGLLILVLIAVNAVFVIAEYAIVRVRTTEIEALAAKGNLRAKTASRVVNQLDKYISATQLGITFVNLLLGWIGEDIFIHLLHPLFAALGINDSLNQTLSVFLGLLIITYFTITLESLRQKHLPLGNISAHRCGSATRLQFSTKSSSRLYGFSMLRLI